MSVKITVVDAFTSQAFAGNPAAVCVLPESRDERWLHAVAREMNLSETAFLWHRGDGYDLRWFTPAVEVDLCGHATLASAHVLWEDEWLPRECAAVFHTRSGVLTATQTGDWIALDFPVERATERPAPPGLVEALGARPCYVGRNRFDYLVELESAGEVRGLRPDFGKLKALGVRGVIVTSRGEGADVDFVSRFFAPAAGIDEDPVTGSAHCCLAPHWSARLNKIEMVGYQASARGGVVRVRLAGDRVLLGGQAVTVIKGMLYA